MGTFIDERAGGRWQHCERLLDDMIAVLGLDHVHHMPMQTANNLVCGAWCKVIR